MKTRSTRGSEHDSRTDRPGSKDSERETGKRIGRDRPNPTTVAAALDRYSDGGDRLRERLAHLSDGERPLSESLQRALYDGRGLPE